MTILDGCFIRHATCRDAADGRRLAEAAYRMYLPRMDRPPAPIMYDYNEIFARDESYLCCSNIFIIGMITLHINDTWIDLSNLVVDPLFQGKGCGRRLLEYAEQHSRLHDRREIRLYTNVAMTENVEIYRKFGYVVTKTAEVDGYQRVFMSKRMMNA
jgi:ribosomal protein S18 acetylase RimI-like enzyme